MLTRVADVYDREVQMAVKRFLAVLEPALILGLAVMIGGIVFSILLGVMGMSELVAVIACLTTGVVAAVRAPGNRLRHEGDRNRWTIGLERARDSAA